jgi:hypothetical protein
MKLLSITVVASLTFQAALGQVDLAGYTTINDLVEHAKIDLDVKDLESFTKVDVDVGKVPDFSAAKNIYENGFYSSKGDKNRTLQSFSTGIQGKFNTLNSGLAEPRYLKEFDLFKTYYGNVSDYANQFALKALEGRDEYDFTIGFTVENSDIIRDQLSKKFVEYLVIPLYTLREMYESLKSCENGEINTKNWEEGIAFTVGSLVQNREDASSGKLFYSFIEKRSTKFGTKDASGVAIPNNKIMASFKKGVELIQSKDCLALEVELKKIRKQFILSLVQGVIQYAWRSDIEERGNFKLMAECWAFTAAVLPFLDEVDSGKANFIRANAELNKNVITQTITNGVEEFSQAVFDILPGLCISCEEIGLGNVNAFFEGASDLSQCVTNQTALENCEALRPSVVLGEEEGEGLGAGAIAGISIFGGLAVALVGFTIWYMSKPIEKASQVTTNEDLEEQK